MRQTSTAVDRRSALRQGLMLGAMTFGAGRALARGIPLARADQPNAESVYRRAIVLDTLMSNAPDFDPLPALEAGITGGVFDLAIYPRDQYQADAELDAWGKAFEAPGGRLKCVLKASDFAAAKSEGKLAVLLNCQDGSILGTPIYANGDMNLDTLRRFHAKGLRVLEPTYSSSNGLGSGYTEASDGGLTRLGRAVLIEMNRLGMLIDLSHCGEKTTLQGIALSTRPVAVTHAGCHALYPDERNKRDAVIRKLADKGGYFGVYNMTLWMTKQPKSSVETIVDHIDHAVKVGGIDLVGFGSDHPINGDPAPQAEKVRSMSDFVARNKGFPAGQPMVGHVTASDLDGVDRLQVLADALARRRYGSAAIEKILGANFIRTFAAACG